MKNPDKSGRVHVLSQICRDSSFLADASAKNINIDSIISRSKDRSSALKILKEKHIQTNFKCISLLEIQGKIIKSINESFNKATLIKWALGRTIRQSGSSDI